MDKYKTGRITIEETSDGFSISVPTKINWFSLIVIPIAFIPWLFVEGFVIPFVMLPGIKSIDSSLIFWIVGWTAAGFLMIRGYVWLIAGKNVLAVDDDYLIIKRKYDPVIKDKVFRLADIKGLAVLPKKDRFLVIGRLELMSRSSRLYYALPWTVGFTYNGVDIQAIDMISEVEAEFIVDKLRERIRNR
jgi:hypothetical protein